MAGEFNGRRNRLARDWREWGWMDHSRRKQVLDALISSSEAGVEIILPEPQLVLDELLADTMRVWLVQDYEDGQHKGFGLMASFKLAGAPADLILHLEFTANGTPRSLSKTATAPRDLKRSLFQSLPENLQQRILGSVRNGWGGAGLNQRHQFEEWNPEDQRFLQKFDECLLGFLRGGKVQAAPKVSAPPRFR